MVVKKNKIFNVYTFIALIVVVTSLSGLVLLNKKQAKLPPHGNGNFNIASPLSVKSSQSHNQLQNGLIKNPLIEGQKYSLLVKNNYNPVNISNNSLQTNTNQLSQGSSNLQSGPSYENPAIQSQIY